MRYVSDARPGMRRYKYGKGFCYRGADGSKISDVNVLRRIKALAIPHGSGGVQAAISWLGKSVKA